MSLGHAQADVQVVVSTTLTDAATGAKVGSKSSTARAHFDINACPDENGIAAGHVEIESQQETTGAGGQQSGGTASAKGPIRLIDGDDAHLIRSEMDVQEQADIHGYDSQTPFEAGISQYIPMSDAAKGPLVVDESHFTQQTTGDADKYKPGSSASLMETLFMSLTRQVAEQTENFWRSGKCIELKPSEKSRNVASHEKLSLTVEAIQRFDSKEVKAAIQGDLSGVESLEPNGRAIEPPAQFDYVAGPNQDDKGSIAFLQVGKRGIGKESREFIVKCSLVTVAYSGTNQFRGPRLTVETQIELAPTQLKCVEDGTYEGAGQLTSKGKSASDHSAAEVTGECHGAFEHTYSVALVAQLDEADPSQMRVGIQGAGDQTTIGASEIAMTDTAHCKYQVMYMGHLIERDKQPATWFPDGIEMWQRMVGNVTVKIGQPKVIASAIGQGGARDETSTKISVTNTPLPSKR